GSRLRPQPPDTGSLDVSEDTVELVQAVVAHDELATAAPARLDRDAGAELLRQLLLEARHIGIALAVAIVRSHPEPDLQAPHQRLGLAHREALARDEQRDLGLLAAFGECEQSASVTHLERALLEELADLGRELQQAQKVRDTRARAADCLRRLLVREAELTHQALERARLLEWVEVLTLYVLDERDRDGGLIGDVTDDGRDVGEPGHRRRPPAPFSGDDLVALRLAVDRGLERTHHDRLHDPLRLDGVGEFSERLGPHVDARLVTSPLQEIERQLGQLLPHGHGRRHGGGGGARAEQIREAAAERGFPVHHRVRSSACAGAAFTGADIVPTSTGLAAGACAGAECALGAVRSVAVAAPAASAVPGVNAVVLRTSPVDSSSRRIISPASAR